VSLEGIAYAFPLFFFMCKPFISNKPARQKKTTLAYNYFFAWHLSPKGWGSRWGFAGLPQFCKLIKQKKTLEKYQVFFGSTLALEFNH